MPIRDIAAGKSELAPPKKEKPANPANKCRHCGGDMVSNEMSEGECCKKCGRWEDIVLASC